MKFEEKIIAFIDILGFKNFVQKAESQSDSSFTLQKLLNLTKALYGESRYKEILKNGSQICPESAFKQKDLNFKVTQISDCVITSSEISAAGLINLLDHCWIATFRLLKEGIMCRGFITKGKIYHTDSQVIGSGYQKAFERENSNIQVFQNKKSEGSTPFVEIDPSIITYLENLKDVCVKKHFKKITRSKQEVYALFPFSRLSRITEQGISSVNYEGEQSKKYINSERKIIENFKVKLSANIENSSHAGKKKMKYYIDFLNRELEHCDQLESDIEMFNSPFLQRRIHP